ncbi:MAG: LysM peptidoglycan-binding domain-containing protein [Treponema sp.]|nr:LysM peptidoglycan-binding domain-containing protein [Treponema sp.]
MQKGETIYSIARSYGVTVEEVLTLNGISDPRQVQAGQRIKIPRTAGAPDQAAPAAGTGDFMYHQAAKGEAFYGIARRYGITVQELRAANSLTEDYVLKAGDMLRIPRNGGAIAVSPPAPRTVPTAGAGGGAAGGGAAAAGGGAGAGSGTALRSTKARTVDTAIKWPVNAKSIQYMTGKLSGVMLLGERSESVQNLTQGTVVSAGPYRGFGKVVIVQMTGGYLYVYGGCESLSVKEGDRVSPGAELGKLGIDGVSAKPQLFFLVYRNNNPVDPVTAPRA